MEGELELDCPVCLTVKRFTPYYCCVNGHNICQDCHKRVQGREEGRKDGGRRKCFRGSETFGNLTEATR